MKNTQNHVMSYQCGMGWQCSFFKVKQQEQRTSTVPSLHTRIRRATRRMSLATENYKNILT